MLSSTLSIAFSLQRYVMNTPRCSETLKKLESTSVLAVCTTLLTISIVLNLNTVFNFTPTVEVFEGEENSNRMYPNLNFKLFTKNIWFVCVFYFNLFINDILCASVIFATDLFLMCSVKENLRKKYQLTSDADLTAKKEKKKRALIKASEEMVKKTMFFSFLSIEKIQQLNLIKKFRENKSSMMKKSGAEFKITLMVVLNGALAILLRLPHLIISFMLVSLSRREEILFRTKFSEEEEFNDRVEFNYNFYNEFSKISYLASLIVKSLIFYTFDRNFQRGLRKLFTFKKKKKQEIDAKPPSVDLRPRFDELGIELIRI